MLLYSQTKKIYIFKEEELFSQSQVYLDIGFISASPTVGTENAELTDNTALDLISVIHRPFVL